MFDYAFRRLAETYDKSRFLVKSGFGVYSAGDGLAANIITNCISFFSSEKFKTDVQPFLGGLEIIKRLKPVAFGWKENGEHYNGLNAEDVADIEPGLVTRTPKGEVEDIKEHSLDVLFINAFKEQQEQIDDSPSKTGACSSNSTPEKNRLLGESAN